MNHRVWVLGAVLLGLLGCSHTPTLPRLQSDDDADRKPELKTIGDVTSVANADPIPVSGVGLVVGLQDTGGSAPPGGYVKMLEEQLGKKVKNVKDLLASPNNAIVMVSGLIPAGARKYDTFDVEITLPQGSRTTSLRGGELVECCLYNYDSSKHLDPSSGGPDKLLVGHVLAKAEGALLVGFGDGDDESSKQCQGRIWGGAKCEASRPFYLALNSDQQYARLAMRIAERVNETFQGSGRTAPGAEIAVAKTKEVVVLGVPPQYRYNLARYLRVVRMIPLQELPPPSSPYRRHLEDDLLDPARTVTAALRLEALGTDSVPILKRGLKSEHVLVRFTSAEALAYLGSPACGEELAQLVEDQPALRAFCLTAMASLDEAVCHVKLRELLSSPSAETRYGAFRALRALDENDAFIQGELLNDAFWLHRVSPNSTSLVHMSSSHRPEIVLFGEDPYLEPPFSFMAGAEFTVTAGREDDKCMVSRFSLRHGTQRRQCSLKLEDVLHAVAEMGGTYPDVTDLLRQAGNCRALTCRVGVDELPQATSVFELARAGAKKTDGRKLDEEIVNSQLDFGATPNLFDAGTSRRRRSSADADAEIIPDARKPRDDTRTSAQRKSPSDD